MAKAASTSARGSSAAEGASRQARAIDAFKRLMFPAEGAALSTIDSIAGHDAPKLSAEGRTIRQKQALSMTDRGWLSTLNTTVSLRPHFPSGLEDGTREGHDFLTQCRTYGTRASIHYPERMLADSIGNDNALIALQKRHSFLRQLGWESNAVYNANAIVNVHLRRLAPDALVALSYQGEERDSTLHVNGSREALSELHDNLSGIIDSLAALSRDEGNGHVIRFLEETKTILDAERRKPKDRFLSERAPVVAKTAAARGVSATIAAPPSQSYRSRRSALSATRGSTRRGPRRITGGGLTAPFEASRGASADDGLPPFPPARGPGFAREDGTTDLLSAGELTAASVAASAAHTSGAPKRDLEAPLLSPEDRAPAAQLTDARAKTCCERLLECLGLS